MSNKLNIAAINRRIDLHVQRGVPHPPIQVHCFNFSRQWPKDVRDKVAKKMMKEADFAPIKVRVLARRIARQQEGIGYLTALELLWRLGAVMSEVMEGRES